MMKAVKNILRILLVGSIMGLVLLTPLPAQAVFTPDDGSPASLVLGQPGFTSNIPTTNQAGMSYPNAVAVDPVSGKIFVSEWGNHRVLRFASLEALTNGTAAEGVLGQADFTHSSPNRGGPVAANTMNAPWGIFVDSSGRLWVADYFNNRVLRFDNAAIKLNGANADRVLGQPGFTMTSPATSQFGMDGPMAVSVSSAGQLWVSDYNNHRVLRFDEAAAKADGADADGVLGQPGFTSRTATTSQNGMAYPTDLYIDQDGRLWVADEFNNRVLRFNNAENKPDGAPADGVLGQVNFTSAVPACTSNGMSGPASVSGDADGRLVVGLWGQSRVLIFHNAANLADGSSANSVLGQTTFTSCGENIGGISAGTLKRPVGTFYDPLSEVLWVADRGNNRVLMYLLPGRTCFVNDDANGVNSGTSWTNAYADLQSALTNPACAEIWVAAGTYRPTSGTYRSASFFLHDMLTLYGGFAGNETELAQRDWKANATILSGDIDGAAGSEDSYHVVSAINLSTRVTLDGFTITGGRADSTELFNADVSSRGGGMYAENSTVTIRNVIFTSNFAFGGGDCLRTAASLFWTM